MIAAAGERRWGGVARSMWLRLGNFTAFLLLVACLVLYVVNCVGCQRDA